MTGACIVLDTKGDNREGGTGVLAKGTSSALWATVYRGMRCCTTKRTCRQRPCGIIAMMLSLRPSIKDITVCWKLDHRPQARTWYRSRQRILFCHRGRYPHECTLFSTLPWSYVPLIRAGFWTLSFRSDRLTLMRADPTTSRICFNWSRRVLC